MLGKARHQLHRLEQDVVQRGVVGILVVGIQGQHAPGQLVHDAPAGVLHDHVLGKPSRQLPGPVHDLVEAGQLFPGGEIAHEQQVGNFLKAKGPCPLVGLHDLVEFNAAVVQLAGHRHPHAILDHVTQHRTHPGDPDGHTGAVAVAQAELDIVPIVPGVNVVLFFNVVAQGTCILFQDASPSFLFHGWPPLSAAATCRPWFPFFSLLIK